MDQDEAFIQSIETNPGEEKPRLVYTDWLEVRGDPRAGYLRLERTWLKLPSTDERYAPLMRRLNELARRLDNEWLIRVSRISQEIYSAWRRAEPKVQRRAAPPSWATRDLVWQDAIKALRSFFGDVAGPAAVAEHFRIPLDYDLFLTRIGGDWTDSHGGWDMWSAERVLERTRSGCQPFVADFGAGHRFWLEIGCVGEKQRHFLCCDLASPWFGLIDAFEDTHPWQGDGEHWPPLPPATAWSFLESLWRFQHLPDEQTRVVTDETGVSCHHPDGRMEHVTWADLQCVELEYRDALWGVERDFIALRDAGTTCLVPHYAAGFDQLLAQIHALPGVDTNALREVRFDPGTVLCWQRSGDGGAM